MGAAGLEGSNRGLRVKATVGVSVLVFVSGRSVERGQTAVSATKPLFFLPLFASFCLEGGHPNGRTAVSLVRVCFGSMLVWELICFYVLNSAELFCLFWERF